VGFVIPCLKPAATEIVLLGTGFSVDITNPDDYQSTENRIVIGLNAACGITKCDYIVVCEDVGAQIWKPFMGPGQFVATGRRVNHALLAGIPHFRLKPFDYPGLLPWVGHLATRLAQQIPWVECLTYIGLDMSYISKGDRLYRYGHLASKVYEKHHLRSSFERDKHAYCLEKDEWKGGSIDDRGKDAFRVHIDLIRKTMNRFPDILKISNCKSFFNWSTDKWGIPDGI